MHEAILTNAKNWFGRNVYATPGTEGRYAYSAGQTPRSAEWINQFSWESGPQPIQLPPQTRTVITNVRPITNILSSPAKVDYVPSGSGLVYEVIPGSSLASATAWKAANPGITNINLTIATPKPGNAGWTSFYNQVMAFKISAFAAVGITVTPTILYNQPITEGTLTASVGGPPRLLAWRVTTATQQRTGSITPTAGGFTPPTYGAPTTVPGSSSTATVPNTGGPAPVVGTGTPWE